MRPEATLVSDHKGLLERKVPRDWQKHPHQAAQRSTRRATWEVQAAVGAKRRWQEQDVRLAGRREKTCCRTDDRKTTKWEESENEEQGAVLSVPPSQL